MSANGQDWSSYQSAQPSVNGLSFVFIKATEGTTYVNPLMAEQAAWARKNGLVVGFYHFARPGSMSAQASFFVENAVSVEGDVLAVDWEDAGVSCADKDALLADVKNLRPSHKVVLYCDLSYWLNVDTTSDCGDGLWIADYGNAAGSPAVQHPWTFHQFSESPEDQDVYNGTVDDLRAWATGAAPAPAPTPQPSVDPMPQPVPDPQPAPTPDPTPVPAVPQWLQLLNHVLVVPEQVYETWITGSGWNNVTQFGAEYGENGVSWCVIFDWDMFHDVGLDSAVPKTDNVTDFSNWAKANGQWSEYPSVGAWVDFGDGAHTEIVTGFDADTVYTKGGNSVQTGAADNGQGNGVWSHTHARRDAYVTGYFAPRFPDGVCPPTADPADPRGGIAVTSWTPDTSTPTPPADPNAFPGASYFGPGARNDYVTRLGQMLVARGGARFYQVGPGPQWGPADQAATQAFQRAQGWTGSDADGICGPQTWALLVSGGGNDIPAETVVSLANVVASARSDAPASGTPMTHPADVLPVEMALAAEGLLSPQYVDGSFGTKTVAAYAQWQQRCGFSGAAADGIPGHESLTKLGSHHDFSVTA